MTLGIGSTIKRDTITIRVETESGVVGYGETHPGRSPGAITSLIANTVAPLVVGMDAFDTNGVWSRVHKMQLASHGTGAAASLALSGIDMALWDVRGKLCNQPLYKLLGDSVKLRVISAPKPSLISRDSGTAPFYFADLGARSLAQGRYQSTSHICFVAPRMKTMQAR